MNINNIFPVFSSNEFRRFALLVLLFAVLFLVLSDHAFATEGTRGDLPYEQPLQKLRESFTGPVAFAVSLIGIVVTLGAFVMGFEMNAFGRALVGLTLVISLVVFANQFLSGFFGRGAEIAMLQPVSVLLWC
jgi:type IV secretion system protein VirB2